MFNIFFVFSFWIKNIQYIRSEFILVVIRLWHNGQTQTTMIYIIVSGFCILSDYRFQRSYEWKFHACSGCMTRGDVNLRYIKLNARSKLTYVGTLGYFGASLAKTMQI